NTPRDSLSRVETMIQMSGLRLSERAMQQQIASAINLVIQIARLSDGVRRITSISEIIGIKRKEIVMQEIYRYERLGVDGDGRVIGRFGPTGVRPRFTERLEVCGLTLPQSLFDVKEEQ
ncbi:MAG: CpaF family protein, partial [Blastocatellia bacterium]